MPTPAPSRLRAAMALSRLRAAMALSRLRAAMALVLTIGLLAGGTAVAQENDAPPPAANADEDADDSGAGAEDSKKNRKNKKKKATEDACDDAAAGDAKTKDDKKAAKADKQKAVGGDETDACAPPRCEAGQVDLAPNEEDANCVSQARLNQLISGFEAAASEEAAALDELALALDELGELNEQLDDLRERLGEVQLRLAAAQADAGFAAIRRAVAGESLDDVAAALASEEDELRAQAVEAYMGGDEVELATSAAMLELEDYTDLETAREYASVVIGDQLATVDDVEALRNAVAALEEVVAAVEAAAVADAERVADIEAQVEELVAQQRLLVTNAEAEAARIAERIGEIQAQKQAYANELRMNGAGGGAIGELLRTSQGSQLPPEASAGLLGLPLENTRLGSPFGPRVHPIFGDARMHTGIDMSGISGEPILASADGIVVVAEETGGYGNVVVVDHGNTIATLYAHMTADAVDVGQTVVDGELLGFVGSTGYSTGPHLHFEVRVNGTPVDPMLYLVLD